VQRRAIDSPEYPHALRDPHCCAHELLQSLYIELPPPVPIDKHQRDLEILRAFRAGQSTFALAERFDLSVQRVRAILRRLANTK